jgi:hypothetical protein
MTTTSLVVGSGSAISDSVRRSGSGIERVGSLAGCQGMLKPRGRVSLQGFCNGRQNPFQVNSSQFMSAHATWIAQIVVPAMS